MFSLKNGCLTQEIVNKRIFFKNKAQNQLPHNRNTQRSAYIKNSRQNYNICDKSSIIPSIRYQLLHKNQQKLKNNTILLENSDYMKNKSKNRIKQIHFLTQIQMKRQSKSILQNRSIQKSIGYHKRQLRMKRQKNARNIFFGDFTSYSKNDRNRTKYLVEKMGKCLMHFCSSTDKIRYLSEQQDNQLLLNNFLGNRECRIMTNKQNMYKN